MKLSFDHYKSAPPPVAVLEEARQLRTGNPPVYLGRTVLGHLIQYFVIGILLGSLSSFTRPVFTNYFHLNTPQANLTKAFTTIVWSCKVGFGILTDCWPMFGYRRKSWMLLGWSLCLISLLILGFKDHGRPYVEDAALFRVKNLTANQRDILANVNLDAPSRGIEMAALCGVVTVFYVMADVAADAMVVEMSQREPDEIRGRLLAYIYGSRNIGSAVSQLLIGSLLNSPPYGGDYTWGIRLNDFFFLLASVVALMVPVVLFMLQETTRTTINCPEYLGEFWQIIQNRPFWQTMLFAFFFNLFTSVLLVTATPIVKYEWAGVSYQNNRWMTAISACTYCIGLWFVSHIANNWSWRWTIAILLLIQITLGALVDFLTIFDAVRDQWFTLTVGAINAITQGGVNLLPCMVYVELAHEGKEGITYGMLTTMANVAYVFTPYMGTGIMNAFQMDPSVAETFDSSEKRFYVTMPIIIGYIASLLACCLVMILPKQKDHIQFLKAYSGKQPGFAVLTMIICFGSFIATITTSILSVFPSTMCLAVGGGTDC